jgi:hypothetical protein
MKSWKQRGRLAVIVAASFVLLVTVLPEIASGFGLTVLGNRLASSVSCSSGGSSTGSSTGSSSSVCSGSGTVRGTVTVTGAPPNFIPAYVGAGACPASGPPGLVCANPIYSLSSSGRYTLSLPAGTWNVDGFYEINGFGGPFLGIARVVTVTAGESLTQNLTVPYRNPAALTGTISVTNIPAGQQVQEFTVLLCPSYAPYNGVTSSIACVNSYNIASSPGATSSTYSITGLPPGSWTAYPGYCAQFGCETNAAAGRAFTLWSGLTRTQDLSTRFIIPGKGFLSGTVTVTGAPTGFADPVGVTACQAGTTSCQSFYGTSGNSFGMLLPAGKWNVTGFYQSSPYNNAVDGPTKSVTIINGFVTNIALSVPFQVPGTAWGRIVVTGLPPGVTVSNYTMLACPASAPWTGGLTSPQCVSEYSGPGGYGYGSANRSATKSAGPASASHPPAGFAGPAQSAPYNAYYLPTLTPGPWILYPGYGTAFGSYTDQTGTSVTIVAKKTTLRGVTVPYQPPADGAVVGTVVVIGAPAGGWQSGAQACTAPPTSTSCPGEQDAYSQSGGAYTMLLSPGTWWVRGFVDFYSSSGPHQSNTQPRVLQVTAGVQATENFTVLG